LRVRSDVNHPTQQGENMRAIAVNGSPRKNWKTPTAHVARPSSSAGTFSRWWKTVYGQVLPDLPGADSRPRAYLSGNLNFIGQMPGIKEKT
jgi:hypothetical protein